jgi:hypothetical protein
MALFILSNGVLALEFCGVYNAFKKVAHACLKLANDLTKLQQNCVAKFQVSYVCKADPEAKIYFLNV